MPDRIAAHYERHAHSFDSARRKNFGEKHWLDRFLLALPRGGHILDLGCGAGEPIARYMIDGGFNITGVDLSEKLITLARIRFSRQRWLRADMRAAAMDRRFSGVLAWDSLFYLRREEQAAMIVRSAGWLEPGGLLLFNSEPPKTAPGKHSSEELHRPPLPPADVRLLFEELAFEELAFAPDDRSSDGRTVWLARKL